MTRTFSQRIWPRKICSALAFLAVACAFCVLAPVLAPASPVWVRIDLVENTVEGPAFDRCTVEQSMRKVRDGHHWRLFYGETRPDPDAGWQPVRSRSGCTLADSQRSPNSWSLGGSPYLLLDVAVVSTAASQRAIRLELALTISKLTGFATTGTPAYSEKHDSRTVWVPAGESAAIPVLIAERKEMDAFGVRELLLRFHAVEAESGERSDYGEILVNADVPRASILLDGGFVAYTSAEGPVRVATVRTGHREVLVRDLSGREANAAARVDKGRTATVSLALLPKAAAAGAAPLLPLGRNPQGNDEFWRGKDGAIVVRIPGGEFRMGSPEGEGESAEHPQHVVHINGFLMDKTEVTWGQYRRFAMQTGRTLPKTPVWGMPEAFPASNITWEDARSFCAWAGGRLPTEAEWERAARGAEARRYPWGDDWDPARCNTRDGGVHAPSAAGAYADCLSPYGVLDLAGSVGEWCEDWYGADYYAKSPAENPTGPDTGRTRVSRGGWWMNAASFVRGAYRQGFDPGWPDPTRGFRCVQDDQRGTGK